MLLCMFLLPWAKHAGHAKRKYSGGSGGDDDPYVKETIHTSTSSSMKREESQSTSKSSSTIFTKSFGLVETVEVNGMYFSVSEQVAAELKKYKEIVTKYKTSITSIQHALTTDERQSAILEDELAKCKSGLSASDASALEQGAKLKKLTGTLSDVMDELSLAKKTILALKSSVTMEQGSAASCHAKLSTEQGRLAKANEGLKTCVSSLDANEQKLMGANSDKKQCSNKLVVISKMLETTKKELTVIRASLIKTKETFTTLIKTKTDTIRKKCSDNMASTLKSCETALSQCQAKLTRTKTPAPAVPLKHAWKNCWWKCGKKSGPCNWCGGGKCCRKGWSKPGLGCTVVANGEVQGVGGRNYHACVNGGSIDQKFVTGGYREYGLPAPGTACVGGCVVKSGRWGKSYCWTSKDQSGKKWGAPCMPAN